MGSVRCIMSGVRVLRGLTRPIQAIAFPSQGFRCLSTGGATADGGGHQHKHQASEGYRAAVALTAAAALALKVFNERERLLLQAESSDSDVVAHENRVRMYMNPDKIFNYFASFQITSKKGLSEGRKDLMMAPLDFYASIPPDCTLFHGVGSGIHVDVTEEEVNAGSIYSEKSPVNESVLNKLGENGLLSYSDYCFLLTLLSTPIRFTDTAFNLFDVTGDGEIEAKEFAYVSTKMAAKAGGFGSYTNLDQEEILESNSGLLNYLFGKDRKGKLDRQRFTKLQSDLQEEVIKLEFSEYDKDGSGRISEVDLCKFLLKNSKIPPKKKASMLRKVEKQYPSKARGISFPSFHNLFLVLVSGAELERALFFLDVEGIGVDMEEFRKISSWVSRKELSDHVAKVLFLLLDDDGDGRFFKEEISHVLLEWRNARGFDKGSIHVSMGQLKV